MKVFEVLSERTDVQTQNVIQERKYVVAEENTLKAVVDYMTEECENYGSELKGVREIVTVVQTIKNFNSGRM